MKVIVINDDDGHCTVLKRTPQNMRALVEHLHEIGRGCADDPVPEDDGDLEAWLYRAYVLDRSGGGQIYLVDVEDDWNFSYGPFG